MIRQTTRSLAELAQQLPIVLDRATAAQLLPHAGAMCLLEAVTACDNNAIQCTANSHQSRDNPLRENDRLPIVAGIEYAAQAIAIHGTLGAKAGREPGFDTTPRRGYLATLKQVEWTHARLDTVDTALIVEAEQLESIDGASSYCFSVRSASTVLLSGTTMVALA